MAFARSLRLLLVVLVLALVAPAGADAAAGRPQLWVSKRADRTHAVRRSSHVVAGDVHLFVARTARTGDVRGITKVRYAVDGTAKGTDRSAPFTLTVRRARLAAGRHRVTADVTLTDGSTLTLRSTLTVEAATTTSSPRRSGGGGGGGGSRKKTTTTTTTAPPAPAPTTTTTTAPPPVSLTSTGRVPRFSPSAFWYHRIPADAPAHPQSADLVADFERQWRQYYGNVSINTTTYAPPVFVADADDPRQDIRFWDCQGKGYVPAGLVEQLRGVPIPDGLQPSAGTDAELVIHDPATDAVWELWRTRRASDGTWEACWGGRLAGASTSEGVFPNPYGTTATGLSLAGGLITAEELAAGRIDHALSISLPEPRRAAFSWPANRTDGWLDSATAIPEGLRLRLDPTIDVDALPITRTAKTIAKALQTYGMVVRDTSGAVVFAAENHVAEGRPDPYPALFGAPSYSVLAGIPWHRLQALPVDYGRP